MMIALPCVIIIACSETETPPAAPSNFENPTAIAIDGYNSHAMEPFVSKDGTLLFFNNPTEGTIDANIHYASYVNPTTFKYEGLLPGVNTLELEGVPSMDALGNFYYTSLATYALNSLSIYRGSYSNGVVTGATAIDQNLTKNQPGMVDMDAVISDDGETLVLAIAKFSGNNYPDESNFIIATKVNGQFVRASNSDAVLININTDKLEYAAALSQDGLELFFTRLDISKTPFEFHIMSSTRSSKNDPFGIPKNVEAITGDIFEGPTLSGTGKDLFYHKKESNVFRIYRVTRK